MNATALQKKKNIQISLNLFYRTLGDEYKYVSLFVAESRDSKLFSGIY